MMLSYKYLRNVCGCLRKLWAGLSLAFVVLAQLLFFGTASADPFPPTWGPIGSAPTSAVHFPVVPWPNEPANPANCGESCGSWLPYRYFGSTVNDPRIQDPSNGGTAPQNYVNISSSCVDQAKPSVYYYLDKTHNTLLFRWRVEQIANNYATGPNPSTQVTDNPWNSALWTVFFDLNGDGYRDFAAHLNGSSGDPSSQVDRLQGIWGNVPSNQSLDYVNDPNIHLLKHNPTGFVDGSTGRLLNFNNSLTPSAVWPNGASERTWDYGTSRSRIVSQANVDGATCNEYFVDYQIPMGLLDASNYPDAPKIDDNTPLSMLFCTANSLNNPFQKDCAYNGAWVAEPSQPAPFGDYLTLGGGLIYQPIVDKVQANGCGPVNLATTVKDTLYTTANVAATSVKGVDFYYYTDTNGNGLADDAGSTWTLATSATPSSLNMWQATWNNIPNLNGSYLIGVQAIDDGSRMAGGTVNRTFSYLTSAEVAQIAGQAPTGENWAANPAVTGAQSTALYLNTCGVPQPYITKAAGAATVSAGSTVAFTLTVHNTLSTALAVNYIQDSLPPGFTFASFDSLSLGSPSAVPSVGASGTITWAFSSPASVPAGSTLRLVFHARAPNTPGTYSNVAAAVTGSGTLVSDPVQVSVGTPRLTIAKAANTETLKPGDAVTYTITYANNSPVNVTGAVITDVVPTGLSNITPLDNGVYVASSRTLTWTIGAIASGAGPFTVRFTAQADSPYGGANPLVNTANIDSVETDPASASSSTFISYPAPQLILQKSASPTLIDAGKDVTFTLRYQNVGSADATGVVITDTLPLGFSFVSATNGGVNTSGTVQWTVGTVGPFASNKVDLVLRANATYTATNPQTNTAWIRSVETAAISASARVGINTTGQACTTYYFQKDTVTVSNTQELRATQTKPVSTTIGWSGTLVTAPASTNPFSETLRFYQDPAATTDIAIAGTITTTFYVDRNPGIGVDLHATVYDYNPVTGYRTSLGSYIQAYSGSSVEPMTFYVPSAGTLRKGHRLLWVVDVLAANKSPVDVLIQYGGTVTNTLSAPATTSYAESRSTLCVTPPANLSLQKQVNKQQVTLGDTVVYTLTFANSGATGVTNAKITDTLPSGLTYQSAALNGAAVTPVSTSGQTVVFAVNSPVQAGGVIAGSAGGTLVITGAVASSLPLATTSFLNQAILESDQTLAVTASAESTVVQPNLSIAKHVSQSLLAPGDPVTYTIVVQNTGTYTATNVTVSDTLPATAYYTYAAASTRVNNIEVSNAVVGNLLSVNVGSLGPGSTATVAFSMNVASSGAPDGVTILSNTAAVTSTATTAKTSQPVDVFISTNPNLAISKEIEPAGSLAPGDMVTYTLAVTNTGRGDALNVEVVDPLPANAAYVFGSLALDGSARTDVQDADNARFEAANNRVRFTIGTLTQGQTHRMVFHARVAAPLPNGISPVDNLAYVSASNTATKDALVSSLAAAAPVLALDKQGPSVVAYPAAKVVTTAAAATTVEVDSAAQLVVGQYVSINGQQRKITAIDGHAITVASSLSVTAGQTVVGSFSYDIAYRNTGNAAASGVSVVDTLPAGVTLVETSPSAQVSGSSLTWDIGTLDPDERGVLRVVVLPTASGVLTNNAVLYSSETVSKTASVATTVGGLIVSKRTTTPSVEQTPTGTTATYVIEVQNTLATAASGVIVTDTLPPGFVYQATVGTPNGGTRSPSTPTPAAGSAQPSWGNFSIPANTTLAITFTASIAAEVGAATYQNAVFATATNAATTQFDELSTSAEDVTVLLPQMILAKTVTPSQVTAGDTVTYTITAQNVGGAPARTLQISDVLPSGFSYAGPTVVSTLTATRTATLNPTFGNVLPAWGAWDIAPGGTLTLTFAVDTAHSAGTYYNDVNAGGANAAVPSLEDTAPVTLTAAVADLRLAKIGTPATQYVGQNVVFTLTLANDGPNAATNVTVSDTLPSGFTYVSSSASAGTYNATSGLWTVGELNPAGSSTLVITATVNAAGSYTNYAQVASSDEVDGDSTPGNNSSTEDDDDSVTIGVVPVADLRLAKAGAPASQYVGQSVVFTLTLANDGPSAASGVTVNDLLPSGFTYTASRAGQGTYDDKTGLWAVGSLGKNAVTTLVLTATVNSAGSYTNYAQVANSDQYDGDSTPGNSSSTEDDDDTVTITAIPVADLRLAKIGTPATQYVDQNVVFTLTLTNDGPNAADSVTVNDLLPSGFTYSASSATQGTYNNTSGLWTVGSLSKDAGAALVITATVNASGSYTNYAQVAHSDQHDGDSTPGNNSTTEDDDDSVTITAVPVADLRLAKIGTPPTQYVGENVVFTLTLTNDGPSAASSVTVNDLLPNGFTYSASTAGQGTYNDTTGLWTIGSLGKDAGTTLVITASVNASGSYTNYAQVAHSGELDPDSTPDNNSSTEDDDDSVTIAADPVADLRLAKAGSPGTQYVGQDVVFTLTLTNDGPSVAGGVTVTDTLPSGFTYSASKAAQGTYDDTTGLWTVGSLNKDAKTTLVITATVNADGSYTNYAQVASSEQHDGDSTPGNNSTTEDDDDSVTITAVPVADLRLAKAGSPSSQYVGQTVVFTLTLTNDGPSAASNVTVSDTLPTGFTYVDSLPVYGTYDKDSGLWAVGSLDKDAARTLVITATVNASGSYTNYAQVAHSGELDPDSTPGNSIKTEDDDDSITITAVPVADLRLAKAGSPGTQYVGQDVVFTLTLTNDGPSAAGGVTVSDTLPSGFTYTASSAGQGTYDDTTGVWMIGSLDKNAGTTLVITATVNADGSYTNYAQVANSGELDPDSTPGNNSSVEDDDDSVTITAVPVADLRLAKTGTPATQYVGQTVVFTLTLTNDGPSAASRVTVSDTLPSGFTYVGALAAGGTYDDTNGLWAVGSLDKDAARTLVITATVNASGSYTNYAQVAHSDQYDGDSTPGNDSSLEDDNDSVTITVMPVADLRLAKTATPATKYVGQNVVFTLTLENDGPSAASGVAVSDTLPSGFAYVDSLASDGSYDQETGLWSVGSLSKDAATTLVITATVNAGGSYTNYAQVAHSDQHDGDSTPANNSTTEDDDDSVTIAAVPVADLHLAKSGTPATQYVGQNVVFTLTLTNDGPSAATGVTVTDLLPNGFTYVDSLPADGIYNKNTGAWTVANLDKDEDTTLVITTTVNTLGSYTNYAEIKSADQYDGDSTPGNASTTEDDDESVTVTAIPVADLSLAKTGSPAAQDVGQNVVFTLTVTNGGPSAASGVTVSDTLPSGFTYVDSLAAAGSYDKDSGLWTVGSLSKDVAATLVITAAVNAAGDYINNAEVAHSDQYDGDSTAGNSSTTEDDDDSFTVTPVPVIDLRLVESGNPATQYVGQIVVFTLTLTNDGPSAASGVTVSDTLPGGFAYQDSLPADGTYDKDTGVWTVGSLAKDAGTTLVITATVNAGGSYTNYVEVASAAERDLDSTPANSSTTEDDDDTFVVTPVPVADLHLEKTGAPARQQVGQNVVFTLTLTNDGPSAASSVTVTDLLPSGFTYVGAAAAAGAYDKDTGLWTVGSLDKDAGISLVITATVSASGTYTNYAEVASSAELDPDSTPANGSTTEDDDGEFVVTPTAVADLSLAKAGSPAVQYVGQNVVFTLTLANGGPSAASNVMVNDTLPSGFTYADSLASSGAYDSGSGLWTVGDLSAGANATLLVTATLNAAGDYTNYAEVAASDQIDNDSTPANISTTEDDDDQFSVTPVALVDLSLAKTGNPAVQYVGQNVVFTLTLANGGPSAASGIVVSDALPSGFTYVGSLPSAGAYTPGNGAWTVESLSAGANAALVLTATVNATGTYTNYAEIAAVAQVDRDSVPGNHSTIEDDDDSFVVTPVPVVDLSLAKSGAPLAPIVGRSIVFTLTVSNGGPSTATGITVRDLLPSGYTFVAAQATAGSYTGGLWTLGSLDAGANAILQISATVNISGTYVNYAEIAGCGQNDVDSTPGNSSTSEDDDDSITPVPVTTATIGNYVWLDANQDGVQGAGEGGVAGVMVQLFRADNTLVASKLTDRAGKYEFSGLQPNNYYLQFTLPPGYVATLLDAPAAMGDTADSDGGADGKTPVTNLASGEIDLSWDFGLVLPAAPAAIGDIVWLDTDMDGRQDAGESGVPGVIVQLFKADNTPVAAMSTDAAGHYVFSNLSAGDYYVLFTPPGGYAISPKDVSAESGNDALTGGTLDSDVGADGKTPVTSLAAGETDSTWDLGLYLPAQPAIVGGSVWLDSVQDGLQGAAESGVPGVAVQLYRADDTLVAATLTDAAGVYRFANLPPGDYYVQIVPPAGYLITLQDAAGETGSDPVTGGSGDSDAGADGKMPVTSLAAGETDLTWDGGIYLPAPPVSVGSYVWLDVNHDGIQDAGETGVPGVTVELFNQAGALLTAAHTDAEGRYLFANLLPGTYYLHFVLPAGYTISPLDAARDDAVDSDADQVTGLTVPFSLSAGEQSPHWSMGLVLPAAPASLGDRVWLDTNGDGVQDITEQGVPAVTVHLLDTSGAVVKSTVTGESGKYAFDNLPGGIYALQFVPPPGYSLTKPDVLADFADSDADPATGRTVTFTLASGQRNPTLDAGLYLPEPPVSIGHIVWYDADQDGVQDAGETGVPGVPVMIYRVDGTFVGAAITDNTGSYRFDRLPAGDYYIRFVPPSLYTISPQDTGTDDASDSDVDPVTGRTTAATFSPGVADLTWDMGLYLPASPSVFSGDTWIDINNNGIQEAGEPPVADVVVKLFDTGEQPTADGTLLAETKTGADGHYEFDNLAQGAYYLAFVPKQGYAAALADIGSDSFDSDASAVTGRTVVYVLAAGERADSVSAGYVPLLSVGDLVFNDFRNNGIYEPVEDDGVDGVKVNIYHDADADGVLSAADGDPVATTITDNGGRYLFTGLTPGDYVVELDDSNFADGGLIRMFASSLSSRNAAVEPIMDPDNDVDGDDNGYDSHAPDGGVDIVSPAISLAFNAEPTTDGDLNPSSNLSLDFGIYDPTVGNRVWLDRDIDGVQDIGEPGIAGVVMNIFLDSNTNGMLDEHDRYLRGLTTNADGVYLFTFLAPGDYVIQVAPANFEAGGVLAGWHPAAGGSDPDDDVNTDSNGIADAYGGVSALAITLTSGGEPIDDGDTDEFTNLTVDFGFWPDPSALGDYVWWDYNKNGIQDVGELPVAGVTATLYSTAAGIGTQPLAETKTDQQGKYLFTNLVPGSYYIQFTMPPQYGITNFQAGSSRSADSDVNADGKTPVMNVRAGTDDRDCDLGLIYPTAETEVPEPGSADNLFLPLVSN